MFFTESSYLNDGVWTSLPFGPISGIFYSDKSKEYIAIESDGPMKIYVCKDKDFVDYKLCDDIVKTDVYGCKIAAQLEDETIILLYSRDVGVLSYENKTCNKKSSLDCTYIGDGDCDCCGICYGDGVLMIMSSRYDFAVSSNNGDTWTGYEFADGLSGRCGLAFGKGGFWVLNCEGTLEISTNKGKSWQNLGRVSPEWERQKDYIGNCLIYSGDAFYAIDGDSNIYRSPTCIDLTKKS